jgi:hypothetical protein
MSTQKIIAIKRKMHLKVIAHLIGFLAIFNRNFQLISINNKEVAGSNGF